MTEPDPLVDIARRLIERRDRLRHELDRVEAALRELMPALPVAVPPGLKHPDFLSVRGKVKLLLEEGNRDWSAGEIAREWEARGHPIHSTNVDNAIRAALSDAKKAGEIESVGYGRYRAMKWAGYPIDLNPDERLRTIWEEMSIPSPGDEFHGGEEVR